jgi:hypothetical protein
MFFVDLNLLVGMDNVSVFHTGWFLKCGKTVKKVRHFY